jgi:hypothetical protein
VDYVYWDRCVIPFRNARVLVAPAVDEATATSTMRSESLIPSHSLQASDELARRHNSSVFKQIESPLYLHFFVSALKSMERVKGIEPSFDLLMGAELFDKAQHDFF